MPKRKKSHYAVAVGRRPGIYRSWIECSAQVTGYPAAKFKGFTSLEEAQDFLASNGASSSAEAAATKTNASSVPDDSLSGGANYGAIAAGMGHFNGDDGVIDLSYDSPPVIAKKARMDLPNTSVSKNDDNDQKKPAAAASSVKSESDLPIDLCSSDFESDAHGNGMNGVFSETTQSRSGKSGAVKSEQEMVAAADPAYSIASAAAASSHKTSYSGEARLGNSPMTLHPMQARAVAAAKRGDNVFITGPAGTGKSVVLKQILSHLKSKYRNNPYKYVAVAPTGPTAIAVGGQTIHSFAGCGVPECSEDFDKCWEKQHRKKWRDLDVMVVEEVSMISGELWDRLSYIVSKIRGQPSSVPFGGIQLVLVGDFLQLKPIPKQEYKIKQARDALRRQGKDNVDLHMDRGFAFQSRAWANAKLEVIQLDQVFRQSCDNFVSVLHEIRMGKVSPASLRFLQRCNRPLPPTPDGIEPTVLYATNRDVSAENMKHLNKLKGNPLQFTARDFAEPEEGAPGWVESALLRNGFFRQCLAEETLTLKVGAQVMLIKNEQGENASSHTRLVNGSRGKIIGFTDAEEDEEDDSDVEDEKLSAERGRYPVVLFNGGRRKVVHAERFESRIVGMGTCVRETIPLKLAWAVTMHKSQGLTLDYVKADVTGVFTEAQAYVALSRATNEDGLELRGFSSRIVRADKRALRFYSNPNGDHGRWDQLNDLEEAESAGPPSPNENAGQSGLVRVPAAKKGCFEGLAFVLTGEPENYSRDEAEKLIRDCGGLVRSAVSGKTNYLVVGKALDDGRPVTSSNKYKKAKGIVDGENNKSALKIITKDELFSLIHGHN